LAIGAPPPGPVFPFSEAVNISNRRGCGFASVEYNDAMNEKAHSHHARIKRPQRRQIELQMASLDQMVPADHRVRIVWRFVESLDLTPLYRQIRAVEGHPGRDSIDPRILITLWLFATIEGISSAREIDRRCARDVVYRWICGGVGVNYHSISDFRTDHCDFLDQLLTDTITALLHQDLITLDIVAQDGMRVRASAGKSSFRRRVTLEKCREEAAERVRQLREERENNHDGDHGNARQQAARERAAREREERINKALEELDQLQAQKEHLKKGSGENARASTTDPEARVMKMANNGYNPAVNVQFVTDARTRLIAAVDTINSGSDRGQMGPMHEGIRKRYGKSPGKYLVDGGFAIKDDITLVEQNGSEVIAPIHGEDGMRARGKDPHARQRRDTDEMVTFRQRMATEEAKTLYRLRSSVAEFPNAECRNRGLHQFRVRGLAKVKAVALWYALTFNLMRMIQLEFVT
jgi:transposase